MSRKPTKAASNVFCRKRMESAETNKEHRSRESVSDLINIDRTRLAHIELGKRTPYPEEVVLLADTYNAPELCNHYCTQICPIGKQTVQTVELVELKEIAQLSIQLYAALKKSNDVPKILFDILSNSKGEITKNQLPAVFEVIETLDAITKQANSLKVWVNKNLVMSENL